MYRTSIVIGARNSEYPHCAKIQIRSMSRTSKIITAPGTIDSMFPPGLSKECNRENANDWFGLWAVALNIVAYLGKRFNCILPLFTLAMESESENADTAI